MSETLNRIGCLARLAMSKNSPITAEQHDTYAELLADVPMELLRESCRRLAKAQTYGYPTVGDIRAMCDELQRDRVATVRALPAHDEGDRRTWVHCQYCQDDPSAWLPPRWCQGQGRGFVVAENSSLPISTCGRIHSHVPHTFTERCVCHLDAWRNERRIQKLSEDTRSGRSGERGR